jgi:hypothetical protein
MRRSISCMIAGLLIVGPLIAMYLWPEWRPHPIVFIAHLSVCVAGIIWLYDEIADTAEAGGAPAVGS